MYQLQNNPAIGYDRNLKMAETNLWLYTKVLENIWISFLNFFKNVKQKKVMQKDENMQLIK